MSYATWHNSFTSQYLLNKYIYCRFCIINCENKKKKKLKEYEWHCVQCDNSLKKDCYLKMACVVETSSNVNRMHMF
jgi:ribosomal protein L37AE/L43A